jgi:tetratricopeptide (TPR) repeat protein
VGEPGDSGPDAKQAPPPGALTALLRAMAAEPAPEETVQLPLVQGAIVGRFEIVRELGRGAFGVVYEARDRELGRAVALKIVRPGRASSGESQLAREAEAVARLSHPNLVTLYEVGRSEHGPYLVFELLRGTTLQERIDEGPLDVLEAVHTAVDVARGLAHAHAEGVVHRDLKPSNVFVTNRGAVKILDFGMAHAFGRRRVSGGTPAYMAPEQWEENPEDERTDVFALGVMLHRMLSGEYPFPEDGGRWSAGAALATELDVLGTPELGGLVGRMLEKVPASRPRDGAEVLAALEPIEAALRARPAAAASAVRSTGRRATLGSRVAAIKRRRGFRVMAGYALFCFAVLLVIEPVMHAAGLPDRMLKEALVVLVMGFPVVVILSWVYDLTVQGVKRTPSATDPLEPRFGRSRLLRPLAVSATVLAIATGGAGAWYAWKGVSGGRSPGASVPVAGPDGRVMVAVADFVNDTKDPDLDGLSSQLITSLEQSQKLRVLTRSRMVDVLRQLGKANVPVVDEVMGREMARAAGVQALLVASIRRFDQLYAIDLKVLDPSTSEYFFTLKEEREGKAAIPAMLDRLSERARQKLRETPAEVSASRIEVARATTKDYEAWHHYFAGQKFEVAGEAEDAIEEYKKAVAEDPRFALAHYRIAYLGRWIVTEEARSAAMTAALREIDRVPAKERLLILAQKAKMDLRPGEAHALYEQAAEAYPQDKDVLVLAGEMYLEEKRWAQALPWFERVRALDPAWTDANERIIDTALPELGKHQESLALAREWAERAPGPRSQSSLVEALIRAGRPTEAVEASRRLVTIAPGAGWRLYLAKSLIAADRFEEAEMLLEPFVRETAPPRERRDTLMPYAAALALQGRRREAMAAMATWESIPVAADYMAESWFPFNRWILKIDERDPVPALREAALLRRKRDGKQLHAVYLGLPFLGDDRGAAEAAASNKGWDQEIHKAIATWRGGDPDGAVAQFQSLIAREPMVRSLATWWLAYVAFDARQDDVGRRAVESYERIPWESIPLGMWRPWGLGRLLYKKAEAQERAGDRAGAVATVERMLTMWKKADPDLPMLAETRELCRKLGCKVPR